MNTESLILFICSLVIPIAYQRIHFALRSKDFMVTRLRTKTGLQIHHGHWGILWIFISSMWFIFGDKNIYAIVLAGLGWGLLMDEIIPSLRMPSNDRALELQVYGNATRATLALLAIVIVLVALISIFLKY